MKKVESKTSSVATKQKSNKPFFSKEAEGNFFGESTNKESSFFKTSSAYSVNGNGVLQTKLTIGQPNDKYEQEADAAADKVVQRLAVPEPLTKKDTKVQTKPSAIGITPSVQTKCAACEQDEKLQKKEEEDLLQESPLKLQRKPIFESNAEPSDDENDIQRKCEKCEKEDSIQKKSDENSGVTVSSSLEGNLNSAKGSGSSLPEGVRESMESSFDADFSGVRIHTDIDAVEMNKEISAQAFTHGSDIYFNSGKYDSSSTSGQHLLAHELTHVVQQKGAAIKGKPQQLSTSKKAIQRFPYWRPWDENKKVGKAKGAWSTGGDIHNEVFEELTKVSKEIFTEAPVPNADSGGKGWGKRGYADLYKAQGNKTVGFLFEGENDPGYLPTGKRHHLKFTGGQYKHSTKSAPGYFPPTEVRTGGKLVRESEGPTWVRIGDLKPYGDIISEATWSTQVNNYFKGFNMAHDELTDFQGKNNWNLQSTDTMNEGDINPIPDKYRYGSGKGQDSKRLKLAGVPDRYNMVDRNVMGKVYVAYNKTHNGIWNYFWILDTPLTASVMPPVTTTLWAEYTKRLIDPLKDSPLSISPKRETGHGKSNLDKTTISTVNKNEIQTKKATDPFKKNWKPWKADHSRLRGQYLKIKKEKGYKTVEEELLANEAQENINEKLKVTVPVNKTIRQQENKKMHKQLEFWSNKASVVFGYFRLIFGKAFIKIYQVYEALKKRVSTLGKSSKGLSSVGKGIIGAATKVLFKAFKMAGVFLIHETVKLMIDSLQQGVMNKIQAYIDSIVPESYKEKMEKVQKTITNLENLAARGVEDLLNSLFGTHIKIFETINEIAKLSNTISTIVSIVRWGVRVIECVSPPVVGCLWMLVEFVGEALLSQLISSCWFMKKVYPHVVGLKILKDIPVKIASAAIKQISSWMKDGPLEGILAPVSTGGIDPKSFKPECEGGKEPTPAQKALQDMFETLDEDKMYALQQLMEKGHVNPTQELSKEDIEELTKTLQALDTSKLKEFVENYPEEQPDPPGKLISVKEFMKKFDEQKEAVLAQIGQGSTPGQTGTQDPTQSGGQVDDSENEPPGYAEDETARMERIAKKYVEFAKNFKGWNRVTHKKPFYNFKKPIEEIVVGDVIYSSVYGKTGSGVGFFTFARIKILKIKSEPLSWDVQILWTDDAGRTDGKPIPKDELKMVGIKQTILSDKPVRPKLIANQPADKYEQEADAMADKVVQRLTSSVPSIQLKSFPKNNISFVQAKCAECDNEELVHSYSESPSRAAQSSVIETNLDSSKSSGYPIPTPTKGQMENSFGADFSDVRIHNDSSAIQMSKDLNAQAFTNGNDIYFNTGRFDPKSKSGQHLLAHELTHVLQQNSTDINGNSPPQNKKIPDIQTGLFDTAEKMILEQHLLLNMPERIEKGVDVATFASQFFAQEDIKKGNLVLLRERYTHFYKELAKIDLWLTKKVDLSPENRELLEKDKRAIITLLSTPVSLNTNIDVTKFTLFEMQQEIDKIRLWLQTADEAALKKNAGLINSLQKILLLIRMNEDPPVFWGLDQKTMKRYLNVKHPGFASETIAFYLYGDTSKTNLITNPDGSAAPSFIATGHSVSFDENTVSQMTTIAQTAKIQLKTNGSDFSALGENQGNVTSVVISGKNYTVTSVQLKVLLSSMFNKFRQLYQIELEYLQDQLKVYTDHEGGSNWAVRGYSDTLGGAEFDKEYYVDRIKNGKQYLAKLNEYTEADATPELVTEMERKWSLMKGTGEMIVSDINQYMNDTISGASTAIKGLEVAKIAGNIAASFVPGLGIVYGGLQDAAQQASGLAMGTQHKWDFKSTRNNLIMGLASFGVGKSIGAIGQAGAKYLPGVASQVTKLANAGVVGKLVTGTTSAIAENVASSPILTHIESLINKGEFASYDEVIGGMKDQFSAQNLILAGGGAALQGKLPEDIHLGGRKTKGYPTLPEALAGKTTAMSPIKSEALKQETVDPLKPTRTEVESKTPEPIEIPKVDIPEPKPADLETPTLGTSKHENPQEIESANIIAEEPVYINGEEHRSVVSKDAAGVCSEPCVVINIEYHEELQTSSRLRKRFETIQKLRRKGKYEQAAKKAKKLIIDLEAVRQRRYDEESGLLDEQIERESDLVDEMMNPEPENYLDEDVHNTLEEERLHIANARQAGADALVRHHVFPQTMREWFEARGFTGDRNIDGFTVALSEGFHQALHGGGDWRLAMRIWHREWVTLVRRTLIDIETNMGRELRYEEIVPIVRSLMHAQGVPEEFIHYRTGEQMPPPWDN